MHLIIHVWIQKSLGIGKMLNLVKMRYMDNAGGKLQRIVMDNHVQFYQQQLLSRKVFNTLPSSVKQVLIFKLNR